MPHNDTNRPDPAPDLDDRVLTMHELLAVLPVDRTTIYRMVRAGNFPASIQLTSSRVGWRWSTVKRWLDDREANPPRRRGYFGAPPTRKEAPSRG